MQASQTSFAQSIQNLCQVQKASELMEFHALDLKVHLNHAKGDVHKINMIEAAHAMSVAMGDVSLNEAMPILDDLIDRIHDGELSYNMAEEELLQKHFVPRNTVDFGYFG